MAWSSAVVAVDWVVLGGPRCVVAVVVELRGVLVLRQGPLLCRSNGPGLSCEGCAGLDGYFQGIEIGLVCLEAFLNLVRLARDHPDRLCNWSP